MKTTCLKRIKQLLSELWLVSKLAFFISIILSAFLSLFIDATTYEIAKQISPLFILFLNVFSIVVRFTKC
ncbi:hypothetical protein AVCANL279_08640 [Campylobacter canadensis]|uniref:hypothetical protein n=1 Tax=Campylobacter canadensis TaxID=449520 RepID=UPI001555C1EC|nr:hypothetical protein [Campylobacter canadensis]MBZ7997376.1 hypothetical protein [Campylobacter canadensis]MBZ7999478.1 hypothetical protein [Campylobacter canadensis]